jgi:hypothetical protein
LLMPRVSATRFERLVERIAFICEDSRRRRYRLSTMVRAGASHTTVETPTIPRTP